MTLVEEQIEDAVANALTCNEPASSITTPLVLMLARLVVGVHRKTGIDPETLVEILRNQLDEAVVHYAHDPQAH